MQRRGYEIQRAGGKYIVQLVLIVFITWHYTFDFLVLLKADEGLWVLSSPMTIKVPAAQ